jgi:hypothetical protein
MAKTVRVPEKSSEQLTVLVGKLTAEKLEKQTYSDAIKYLIDHHVIFSLEMISHIKELINNNQLSYTSKEELFHDAARRTPYIERK